MKKKRPYSLSNVIILSSITLFCCGIFYATEWNTFGKESLRSEFSILIHSNNTIKLLSQSFADDQDIAVSVSQIKVLPGGQSIGVLLNSKGMIVAGHSSIRNTIGNLNSPAMDAGIDIGDIILKANGEELKNEEHLKDLVQFSGVAKQSILLEIERNNELFYINVSPVYCSESSLYRIGLLIKNSTAGLGTLTFYDPESKIYGALGHVITDVGSTEPFDLSWGKIVGASVQSIHPGKRGQPGEKIGVFHEDKLFSGDILRNTAVGIFGKLVNLPIYNDDALLTVLPASQIHEGPAEILTVLKDEKIEKFSIEITNINLKNPYDGKGMVIRITDPRLLEQTGGIIQGMSGSPVIQNGKLAGAVTHVFVNDPSKGYGVPIEWMLREAEILSLEKINKIAS